MGRPAAVRKGEQYGRLTVIAELKRRAIGGMRRYRCRCDCGNERIVRGTDLRDKSTRSCGCLRRRAATISKGHRFGRLVVIAQEGRNGQGRLRYRCICDCGNETTVIGENLRRKSTRSCGCLNREVARKLFTKHGMSRTPEYRAWKNAKRRCFDPKHPKWKDYGGRGITMSMEWQCSFDRFFRDMGPKPKPKSKYTLDRIDNDGNYEKGNGRWATRSQQRNNQRRSSGR